jgi:hypothetical protein
MPLKGTQVFRCRGVGRAAQEGREHLDAADVAALVAGEKLRTRMSSIMRARKGLMGSFGSGVLTGVSCLEVGVLAPSILKTERPARYRTPVSWLAQPKQLVRAALSRASGFVQLRERLCLLR